MIIGVFFLILVSVAVPAVGQVFRDYQRLNTQYTGQCVPELGKLSHTFVEGQQCPQKYIYTDDATQNTCRISSSSTASCFPVVPPCTQSQLQPVWEPSFFAQNTQPTDVSLLACININCCGALVNIYDRPVLALAGISFTFIVYAFYLAIFSFQLSAKDKGDKPLHRTQQLFLIIFFIVLLLVGTILVAVNKGTFDSNRQQLPAFSNSASLQTPTAAL
jgi:hypothetical protein